MDILHISGQAIKFVDRKLWKRDEVGSSSSGKLNLSLTLYSPSKVPQTLTSSSCDEARKIQRKCPIEIDNPLRKRRILKRPKRFKTHFSDRQPLSIPCFEFPRFGEVDPTRGRQTLCKYYHNNEILNEQLLRIKSAQTLDEFEKLLREQLRHNRGFPNGAKSIEPYYDIREILRSETCLCAKDLYRFDCSELLIERQHKISSIPLTSAYTPPPITTTTAAFTAKFNEANVSGSEKRKKESIDDFVHIASECYEKCINNYLYNLDLCNQKAELIERQSVKFSRYDNGNDDIDSGGGIIKSNISSRSRCYSLKSHKIDDSTLVKQINRISIGSLSRIDSRLPSDPIGKSSTTRQSIASLSSASLQTMSCNDTNNNHFNNSTNQLKDPPKIILSDHSTNQIIIQGDKNRSYSDKDKVIDKNSLTVPIANFYTSEARPP